MSLVIKVQVLLSYVVDYIKFKAKGQDNTYILAWTTTPWTLPGNVALAIGEKIEYVKIKVGNESKWICMCGLSNNKPFCDGSHKGTAFTPIIHEIHEIKTVAWCGCKHSANKPFCDGTHKNL